MATSLKRVFISYTHDSDDHKAHVIGLSDRLCNDGVDCSIDQYEVSPPEGWPAWMERMVREADYVLVVCTPTYLERYENRGDRAKGLGGRWEGANIRLELYEGSGFNTKFIPVVFDMRDAASRPQPLRGATYYDVSTEAGYDQIYRHITEQHNRRKPAIGRIRTLAVAPVAHALTQSGLPSDIHSFQEFCGLLRPLIEENGRVYRDFAPNSGANSPGSLRSEFGLWERAKREILVPNNQKIAGLIQEGRNLVPAPHRALFEAWVSHIYAFEKHCEDPTVDYRDHQFPVGVTSVVSTAAARDPTVDSELKDLVARLEGELAPHKDITAAGLFGSQLYAAKARTDVDVVLRLSREARGSDLIPQLKREFLQHHGHHLHCTLFFDDETDAHDAFIRKAGAVHSLNLGFRR
ncbi:toll/interleukin-1 receptor domain-containing protein [Corallococcus sp. bb12-1]|uniref:toll/interleukin-1 receptor domain-containing protein n=1 Tax=Corallococcus sp. bb12-1 TaxID=2996784 RepID=UPI00227063D5|nr:toll/interleukin-1 receptor domain-containing protein [Corallococcus sp. bb12-1]MCY1046883.1 toll/interleukin-1 receptor domain-containing protein [Corallococcus sp. bb12-1]